MRKKIHIPIRFKFMITFLVLVTAVVGLITFSTATHFREDKQAYINDLTSMVALATAEELQSLLTGSRERLQIYVGILVDSGLTADEKSELSQTFFEDFPELLSVSLIRPGEEMFSVYDTAALAAADVSRDAVQSFEEANAPDSATIADGETWVANSTLAPTIPSHLMVFVDRDTVVRAWVRSDRLVNLASRFSAYMISVTDSAGSYLIHSNPDRVTSREAAATHVELASMDDRLSSGVTMEYEREGIVRIGGFAGLGMGNMVASAEIPRSATYLASQSLIRRLLMVAVILIAFALMLAFLWSLRITRPVENLVTATHKIARGDFDVRVERESRDEIGNLADSFTQMASLLQRREEALNEAQAQLIQSEKMAAFGQLGAGVAHEVKNPLAGILASAQIARTEVQEGTQVCEDLKVIEKETKRCRTIIDNLLRFARQEESVKDQVAINDVIRDSVAIVHHQLQLGKVELITELEDNLPCVLANGNQVQQVFMNMMINAQQAMDQTGGCITVRSRTIDQGAVEIRFEDTGPGIPPGVKEKLFEPFFTTKPAGQGTGLGLSVSYGVIEDHGGSISVESEPGQGATFVIALPGLGRAEAETEEASTNELVPA